MAKEYERHPLSAEYGDLTGQEWEEFKAGVRSLGVVGRKVTLHEGKVLDGWQLYRACRELGVKPQFEPLPEGMDPVAFVEMANDRRRHESFAVRQERTRERRQRVVAARNEGKSFRQIAEEEGISKSQAGRLASSGVPWGTPEPAKTLGIASAEVKNGENGVGRTTGADGKSYPAAKPKPVAETNGHAGANGKATATKAPKAAKAPRPGKPVFDDRPFDAIYGKLIRFFDQRKEAHGHGPRQKVKEHEECISAMGLVLAAWNRWQKATT